MSKKFIVNERVIFFATKRMLSPLSGGGKEVLLHLPVCRLFMILLKNKGTVVSHERLMEDVWGANKQVVTMNTLYQNVSLLRRCLKKAGVSPKSVKTYPKVGFCFCGHVKSFDDNEPLQLDDVESNEKSNSLSVMTHKTLHLRNISLIIKKNFQACFILLIILLLFFSISIYNYNTNANIQFKIEKVEVARFNKCPVFLDRGNQHIDVTKILSFLKDKGVNCNENQYIYLTKNFYMDGVVVFMCSLVSDDSLSCISSIKLPKDLQT